MNIPKLLGKMGENKVSQRRLAELTGISKNRINRALNGKREFDLPEAEKICRALHITDPAEQVYIFLSSCPNNGSEV